MLGSSNSGAAWPHLSVVTTRILETFVRGVNLPGATRWGVALRPSYRSHMLRSHGHDMAIPAEGCPSTDHEIGRSIRSRLILLVPVLLRSEERRVGKECRSRWWRCH